MTFLSARNYDLFILLYFSFMLFFLYICSLLYYFYILFSDFYYFLFFFFNDTATPEISPLSQHDALPICSAPPARTRACTRTRSPARNGRLGMKLSPVPVEYARRTPWCGPLFEPATRTAETRELDWDR